MSQEATKSIFIFMCMHICTQENDEDNNITGYFMMLNTYNMHATGCMTTTITKICWEISFKTCSLNIIQKH